MALSKVSRDPVGLHFASLACLPESLIVHIIHFDCISRKDVFNLRLTCGALNNAASIVLFHRITISQLRRDRDAFLNICCSPHLARHVREVEWQEVSWFPGYFLYSASGVDCCRLYSNVEDDDIESYSKRLDDLAAKEFWMTIVPYALPNLAGDSIRLKREQAIREFQDEFNSAIGLLPRLLTFISRPMSAERCLNWDNHPMQACLFRAHHVTYPTEHRRGCGWHIQSNDGLFHFLLPAMERSAKSVSRLLWEDEVPGGSYLRTAHPQAFQRLDALSISFLPRTHGDYDALEDNLRASVNVRHLRLEFLTSPHPKVFQPLEKAMLRIPIRSIKTAWSHLNSLILVSMPLVDKVLPSIVESNIATLRHLHVRDCSTDYMTIINLAGIEGIQLQTLSINEECLWVRERGMVMDAFELFRQKHPETYCRYNYPVYEPDRSEMEIKTVTSYTGADGYKNEYFIEPDPLDHDDDDDQSVTSETSSEDSLDIRLRSGPKWSWARYFHENEQGDIYCHQVPDSDPEGKPTVVWRFVHRTGRVGFSKDPLDWFADWDPEAGDVEEPTPYCTQLYEFWTNFRHVSGFTGSMQVFLGSASDVWETVRHVTPPEGAIKFNRFEASHVKELMFYMY